MILLRTFLDGVYGFEEFEVKFTYPKKIVNSFIEDEHLPDRERFRFCKVALLMGQNASGKTSLGRALEQVFSFIGTGNEDYLLRMVRDNRKGFVTVDFVNEGFVLHRVECKMELFAEKQVEVHYYSAPIGTLDAYEKCVEKLTDYTTKIGGSFTKLGKLIGPLKYHFSLPYQKEIKNIHATSEQELLLTLNAVLKTLDPSLKEVVKARDIKNGYIIRKEGVEAIIQNGKLYTPELLSSGTAEGVDVAYLLANMRTNRDGFYFCDEHFSFIESELEKRIFGIMLGTLGPRGQLIFTTHNTEMLTLNLPKHAFIFLTTKEGPSRVRYASEYLLRNTDSVKNAFENDTFRTIPDDTLLDVLEED